MPSPEANKKYTYADYLTWPEAERWEIIDGTPYMQAAPSWQRQAVSRELLTQINNYLKDKPRQVFAAPFKIVFPNQRSLFSKYRPNQGTVCNNKFLWLSGNYG